LKSSLIFCWIELCIEYPQKEPIVVDHHEYFYTIQAKRFRSWSRNVEESKIWGRRTYPRRRSCRCWGNDACRSQSTPPWSPEAEWREGELSGTDRSLASQPYGPQCLQRLSLCFTGAQGGEQQFPRFPRRKSTLACLARTLEARIQELSFGRSRVIPDGSPGQGIGASPRAPHESRWWSLESFLPAFAGVRRSSRTRPRSSSLWNPGSGWLGYRSTPSIQGVEARTSDAIDPRATSKVGRYWLCLAGTQSPRMGGSVPRATRIQTKAWRLQGTSTSLGWKYEVY